jgi:cAMP-dependent protein kinase regulator
MLLGRLPLAYQNEITTLNREILKHQPADIVQFCANFFNHRLEAERTAFLHPQLQRSPAGDQQGPPAGTMASSSFPGTNPFANPNASPFAKISEEDEYDAGSPTDPARSSGTQPSDSVFSGGDDAAAPPSAFHATGGSGQGLPTNYALGRRTSVSAESLNPTSSGSDSWSPPFHPKSEEQLARLKKAVCGNFLFSHLDDEHLKTVLDALVEKPIPARDIKVITQGDAGDYFYIVEEGHFGVFINSSGSAQSGPDGLGTQVGSIGPGGSFGELALMYNAPRAATIVSLDPKSTLWALDRVTFRRILMDSAFQRRRMYEAFLEEVPVLSSLKSYERSKIADALDTIKHPAGATIIDEGDPGDAFYLLEAGEAEAFKSGSQQPVKSYSRGDYFGELALLDDKPRAASVVAKTDVKVARLGRDGFKRLLGPVEQIMRRTEYDVDPLTKTPTR